MVVNGIRPSLSAGSYEVSEPMFAPRAAKRRVWCGEVVESWE